MRHRCEILGLMRRLLALFHGPLCSGIPGDWGRFPLQGRAGRPSTGPPLPVHGPARPRLIPVRAEQAVPQKVPMTIR